MQNWTKRSSGTTKIIILLFDGFSNHCLANTLEPFRAANTVSGQQLYQWQLLSLAGGLVRSSSGMLVETQMAKGGDLACDYLMIVASYGHQTLSHSKVLSGLRALCGKAKCVIGMDTGSWLLAAAGLLDNRPATIHADIFDSFTETFTQVDTRKERFVMDNNRITCGGAMASFDLVLALIGAQCGEAIRLDVAALFLHQINQPFGDADTEPTRSRLVARALVLMDENIEGPIPITAIAHQLGCSEKALQRRFLEDLGAAPGKVYRYRRLITGRNLIENTALSITEIASRCGYENTSAMTRAFRQQFDMTPTALRTAPLIR
jgi:transcriptional regulator GlxA family with amidase domain